jgi:predicted O-methyltransferase YrrM
MRIDMLPVLADIWRTKKVYANDGSTFDVKHFAIDDNEGQAIYDLIKDQNISASLEVGCAYGISSLYICDALSTHQSRHHTIIDPSQSTTWHSIGISNLRRAGFDFFSLIEKPSEIALPELLANDKKFQFIFIDGWHTFDHTLLDFFYANRLLEEGGFVAIDDADWPSISRVIHYVSKYPNYRIYKRANVAVVSGFGVRYLAKRFVNVSLHAIAKGLPKGYSSEVFTEQFRSPDVRSTMVIFQKTGPDIRRWDWYEPF